jgi:putative membrane protein
MNFLTLFLKGIAMGAANVIPGVSGGTVAFITGIYERLINALKSFSPVTIGLLLKGKWSEFFKATDLNFLAILFLGVAVSILSLAKGMEYAFENYEVLTLSFFFGLIVASIFAVAKQIERINLKTILIFLIGTAVAVGIAFLPPAQANDSFFYVFLCGVVAICSMILPGLSGSYIMVLMGNYALLLKAVYTFNFSVIIPLIVGCVVGLVIFSRVLSYLFNNFKNQTIALLSGFIAGSLLIIWPWKEAIIEIFEGKEKAIGYIWNLPSISTEFLIALVLMFIGFAMVFFLERRASSK